MSTTPIMIAAIPTPREMPIAPSLKKVRPNTSQPIEAANSTNRSSVVRFVARRPAQLKLSFSPGSGHCMTPNWPASDRVM